MKAGHTKVVAAERVRVGRCHGSRYFKRPTVPSWHLWLACGHETKRAAKEAPRSVKCGSCSFNEAMGWFEIRDWKPGEIPDRLGVIRFDKSENIR